ncbi:MAG: tetratricopeptide repeat protein, partial [bacterium]|nr:tetratricopeptide repeat protein [bacterium]
MVSDGSEVNELIHRALALHNSGRLGEAADLYKKILRQDPDHTDALHLLGLAMR